MQTNQSNQVLTTTTQVTNPSTGKLLTYLITDRLLTITSGEATEFIGEQHPLFASLVNFLPRAAEFIIEEQRGTEVLTKTRELLYTELTGGLVVDGKIDGQTCPEALYLRLVDLINQRLPYAPLLKLWANLEANPNLDPEARSQILTVAGTLVAPISWQGDLVLYARPNMLRHNISRLSEFLDVNSKDPATPSARTYRLSTLSYVAALCRDVGTMSDYLVKAGEIVSYQDLQFTVSKLTKISDLAEQHSETGSIVQLQADSIGGTVIRQPFDPATALAVLDQPVANLSQFIPQLEACYHMQGCS
jgi:hypothetical protein